MNTGLSVGRFFGTEIRAHWTWVFVLAVVTVFFGSGLSDQTQAGFDSTWAWGTAVTCAVLVFGSVTAHELAHVWVARRNGIGGNVAVVQLLGGTYLMETRPTTPGQELRSALAGPVVSLFAAAVFAVVAGAVELGWGAASAQPSPTNSVPAGILALGFVSQVLALFNLFLAATNLIPGYPMDGARIVHAVAWVRSGREDLASAASSRVGRLVGYSVVALGALLIPVTEVWPGLTLIIAGWLLVGSSRMLDQRAMIRSLIAGARVIDAADLDPARVPPQLTLDVFAGDFLGERLGGAALVERGDELLGLIGTLQIRRVPRKSWTMTRTEQAMVPVVNVPRTSGDADLWPALEALERSGLDAFLVGPVGQGSALLTRRSASQLIRERAQARAVESHAGLPGLRFPGRRSPKPDPPAGQPNDEPVDEPNDERKDG